MTLTSVLHMRCFHWAFKANGGFSKRLVNGRCPNDAVLLFPLSPARKRLQTTIQTAASIYLSFSVSHHIPYTTQQHASFIEIRSGTFLQFHQ